MLIVKRVSYCVENQEVLNEVNLTLNQGEIIGVTGHNGSGKTTLLLLLMGILKIQEGEIIWNKHARKAILFQESMFPEWIKVKDVISLFSNLQGPCNGENNYDYLLKYISKHKEINHLSGGEKRVLDFVLTLSKKPNVLLLDEPTNMMDERLKKQFWDILQDFIHNGMTIVLVMHDLKILQKWCDRIYELKEGCISSVYSKYDHMDNVSFQSARNDINDVSIN